MEVRRIDSSLKVRARGRRYAATERREMDTESQLNLLFMSISPVETTRHVALGGTAHNETGIQTTDHKFIRQPVRLYQGCAAFTHGQSETWRASENT